MKKVKVLLPAAFAVTLLQGCFYTSSEVELKPIEIKPMHLTIDVNVKIQKELAEKFGQTDALSKNISDKEAQEALQKYMESQKQQN